MPQTSSELILRQNFDCSAPPRALMFRCLIRSVTSVLSTLRRFPKFFRFLLFEAQDSLKGIRS